MLNLEQTLINEIIRIEGGYVDDPNDSGGQTRYGITKATARRSGYYGAMSKLPKYLAYKIYKKRYWSPLKTGRVAEIAPITAVELFDTGVNLGIGRSARFLQRSLNVLDPSANLKVDGKIGSNTLKVLSKYIKKRGKVGDLVLKKMLDSLQGSFYITLAERRVKDKRFIFGWFKNRVG